MPIKTLIKMAGMLYRTPLMKGIEKSRLVMQGYTTIATEIAEQIADIQPTHLFLPGGVGGIQRLYHPSFAESGRT